MKESGGMRLKYAVYESTLSTADAVPLPRWGRLRGAALCADFYKGRCPKVVGIAIRGKRISNIRGGANPVSLRSTAPSRGRGENVGRFECIYPSFLWKEVPAGRRLGAQSGMKEDDADGKTFLHKSLLTRVPYPPLRGPPSPMGKAKRCDAPHQFL